MPTSRRGPSPSDRRPRRFVSDFRDLTIGDYVVHVEHGIAQYQGLKEIVQDGLSVEFMILEFAEQAKLYVPLTRLDLIQKYRSTDTGPAPVLEQARLAAVGQDQGAREESHAGHGRRTAEALRAASHRCRATPSQTTTNSSANLKTPSTTARPTTSSPRSAPSSRTWKSTTPMDRLLCGDVGYGKTEVAMRAAFKAVQDGKQVAVLTPTTVLAFQHFETFKRRFSQFPINSRDDLALPHRRKSRSSSSKKSRPARSTS